MRGKGLLDYYFFFSCWIYLQLCNYHHYLILEHFRHPHKKPCVIQQPFILPILPSPKKPRIYFPSLWICLFWTFHTDGIIQYVIFSWLTCTSHVSRIHPCWSTCRHFFSFCCWITSIACIECILCMQAAFDRQLGFTPFWLWTFTYKRLYGCKFFTSLGFIPRSINC